MRNLIIPGLVQSQQPQGVAQVDNGNPAMRGAMLAVSYSLGATNIVTGKQPDIQVGIRSQSIGLFGVWDSAYGAGADDQYSLPSTGDFAFVAVVDYSSSSGGTSSIMGGDAATNREFQFRFNASNQLEFIRFDTGGNPYFCTVAASSRKGTVIGVSIGSTFKVYFNGVAATSAIGNTPKPISRVSIGSGFGYDVSPASTDKVFAAAVLRGSSVDPMAFSLLANPWQIFKAPPRELFLPTSVPRLAMIPGLVQAQQPQAPSKLSSAYEKSALLAYIPNQGSGRIDTSQYATRDVSGWGNAVQNGIRLHSLFDGSDANRPAPPTKGVTSSGTALAFDGARLLYNNDAVGKSQGAGPDETFIIDVDFTSATGDQVLLGYFSSAFGIEQYGRGIALSGGVIKAIGVSGSNGNVVSSGITPVVGKRYIIAARLSVDGAIFINGAKIASGNLSHAWNYMLSIGAATDQKNTGSFTANAFFSGNMRGAWAFSGGMTDGALVNLTRNPWQIFNAPQREFFTPVPVPTRLATIPGLVQAQQPQGFGQVNTGSPLTKGLALLFDMAQPQPIDLVAQRVWPQNGAVRTITKAGQGQTITQSGTLQPICPAIGTSNTILVYCNPAYSTSPKPIYSQRPPGGGTPQFTFVANMSVAFGTAAGRLVLADGSGANGIEADGVIDGNAHWFLVTRTATTGQVYVDGVPVTTVVTGSSASATGTVDAALGFQAGLGLALGATLGFCALWNRELSRSEVLEVMRNPWQLFKAPQREFFTPVPVPSRLVAMIPGVVQSQQPQGSVQIDRSNPLLRSTTGLWSLSSLTIRDSISGALGSLNSPAQMIRAVRPAGLGINSTRSTVGDYISTGKLASELGIAGASDRTIYGTACYDANNDVQALFTLGVPSTGQDWTLRANGTDNWRLNIWGVVALDFTYHIAPGAQFTFVVTQKGTTAEVWMDGSLRATTTATVNTTDAIFKIGGDAATWPTYQQPVFLLGTASRAWGDAEKSSFCKNPWQVFKAPQRELFMPAAISAGPIAITAGPFAFTALIAEILASIDANTSVGSLIAGITEMATSIDTASTNGAVTASTSEAGTVVDTSAGAALMPASNTESGSAVDVQTGSAFMVASQTDTAAASDSQSGTALMLASQTDTAAASDSQSGTALMLASQTDTGTVVDSSTGTALMLASQTDTGAASDTPAGNTATSASQTDTAAASDSQTGVAVMTAVQNDTGSAVDGQTGSAVMVASQTDTGVASDSQSGTALMLASRTESGSASDNQTGTASQTASQTDTGVASDSQTGTASGLTSGSIADAVAASDTQTGAAAMFASQTDAGTASDIPNVFATFATGLTDFGVVLESPVALLFSTRAISELSAASELIQSIAAYVVAQQENATASDSSSQGGASPGAIIENGVVVDAPVGIGSFFASRTDSIPITDQYTSVAQLTATWTDFASVVDSATSVMVTMLSTSSTMTAVEQLPSYLTYLMGVIEIGTAVEDMAIALGVVYPTTGLSLARTYKIAAENRRIAITAENRTIKN